MPTKEQLLIGTLALVLLVIVVTLVIMRSDIVTHTKVMVPVAAKAPEPFVLRAPAAPAVAEDIKQDIKEEHYNEEPSQPEQQQSEQTVEAHRAELLRGTPMARARQSAPTTSALIMNAALTGRENQSSRQNIGETAVMDRLNPAPSAEMAPW